jgi:uncharacterized membrane protein YkgB
MFFVLNLFSAISFLGFGATCLFSQHMRKEFHRYGLASYRSLTGILQLIAFAGLIVGIWVPVIGLLASGGLALQMLLGVAVRIKIGDSALQCVPATSYFVLNAWLCALYLGRFS